MRTLRDPEEPITEISAEQSQKWLPMLMPHVEKMFADQKIPAPGSSRLDGDRRNRKMELLVPEKQQRHELEKIRAATEFRIPVFDLGRHFKYTTVSLSVPAAGETAAENIGELARDGQKRQLGWQIDAAEIEEHGNSGSYPLK
jgi:hypothetical protein